MKAKICRITEREINLVDAGQQLSAAANTHLRECDACRRSYEEQRSLHQLVGSLGVVTAPADFDFRLKARIANSEARNSSKFRLGRLAFGVPALAAVVLLVAGVMFFRADQTVPKDSSALQTPPEVRSEGQPVMKPSEEQTPLAQVTPEEKRESSRRSANRTVVAAVNRSGSRTVSRDFSSVPASVIRKEEPVASASEIFPIDASYQTMKLSLDDTSGVSRTISLPSVTFGSQRVLGRNAVPAGTANRGDW